MRALATPNAPSLMARRVTARIVFELGGIWGARR